jgi:hypothetical protein
MDEIDELVRDILQTDEVDDELVKSESPLIWLRCLPKSRPLSEKTYVSFIEGGLTLLVLEITPLRVLVSSIDEKTLNSLNDKECSILEALKQGGGLWLVELFDTQNVKCCRNLKCD